MGDAGGSERKAYNLRNPAVKRILQEVKEMAQEQSHEYMSMPLEEDIFEWQFAVHGPKDSEFEGGIYHGRITLPPDYPFKPPSFMLLTPSGRWETHTKICLSISNHHPEHWQPSWSVRTALVALVAFMPTKPNGALGSLEYTKRERRALAVKSRLAPPKFGSPERQLIIQQLHDAMLKTAPPVPTTPLSEDEPSHQPPPQAAGAADSGAPSADQVASPGPAQAPAQAQTKEPSQRKTEVVSGTPSASTSASVGEASGEASTLEASPGTAVGSDMQMPRHADVAPPTTEHGEASAVRRAVTSRGAGVAGGAPVAEVNEAVVPGPQPAAAAGGVARAAARTGSESVQEKFLSLAAVLLLLAILYILSQKIARAYSSISFAGSESEL